MRRTVRTLIKYGVDSIKLNLSGEEITGMGAEETPMSEEEVAMAASEAKCRNKVLSAHARSSGSVKQCVRHGIQNIYHASFADEEALDMLEAHKDRHFVAPGIAWLINTARNAGNGASSPGTKVAMPTSANSKCVSRPEKDAPARNPCLIGGDYGFAWTPQGTNAKDIENFVDMLGFSPMEASRLRQSTAARSWAWANELGLVVKAIWPTSCLIDGDPVANVRILQDKARILAIMKDGSSTRRRG